MRTEVNFEEIESLHLSMINGQKKAAVEMMQEYGMYDFFADYSRMLYSDYCMASAFNYLADAINTYMKLTQK